MILKDDATTEELRQYLFTPEQYKLLQTGRPIPNETRAQKLIRILTYGPENKNEQRMVDAHIRRECKKFQKQWQKDKLAGRIRYNAEPSQKLFRTGTPSKLFTD